MPKFLPATYSFQDTVVQEVESTMNGTVDASNTTLLLVAATIFVHEGK